MGKCRARGELADQLKREAALLPVRALRRFDLKLVAFKTNADSITAVIGGHIQGMISSVSAAHWLDAEYNATKAVMIDLGLAK